MTYIHITCQFSVCSLLFLTSMPVAKQYVSTGTRGQDSPTLFFQNCKKENCIVSFSYYFQFNYTWIWYNITTLVTLSILNSRLKNPFSWNFDKVAAKHQSINQSIDLYKYVMPVSLHLLMMCHVLVLHRKHYNVCSMFIMNIHGMVFPL